MFALISAASFRGCSVCRAVLGSLLVRRLLGAVFAVAPGTSEVTAGAEAVAGGMRVTFGVAGMGIVVAMGIAVEGYRRALANRGDGGRRAWTESRASSGECHFPSVAW